MHAIAPCRSERSHGLRNAGAGWDHPVAVRQSPAFHGECSAEHGNGLCQQGLLLVEPGRDAVGPMRRPKQALEPQLILKPGKGFSRNQAARPSATAGTNHRIWASRRAAWSARMVVAERPRQLTPATRCLCQQHKNPQFAPLSHRLHCSLEQHVPRAGRQRPEHTIIMPDQAADARRGCCSID